MHQSPYVNIGLNLNINGEEKTVTIRLSDTLLDVLREHLGLTGSKPGCLNGDCGSCTVIVGDLPMKSCLMLAVEAADHKVITIEGLKNTPIQQAFIEKFAFQCGYCTPGFIMNAYALISHHPRAAYETVKEWLESNICRCTSYQEIEEAVMSCLQPPEI